ncbi:MAG: cupin domain-containing protein [Oscillospiraceae bacterium]|jgi:hypothetical protein|nr:cupin domain-containing protein [Oscillospiraceae bacterium]
MAARNGGKFDHLFFELTPPYTGFRGMEDIPNSVYSLTYQNVTEPTKLEPNLHAHREEQYLTFLGGELPDVFSSWDAKIELKLGPTKDAVQTITITKPTIVRVPVGWIHGQINFVEVKKPLTFQKQLLAGSYAEFPDTVGVAASLIAANGEQLTIDDLVCKLTIETTEWGDWCPTPQAYFRGQTYMKEAGLHVGFQVFTGDFPMEDAHMHQGEEYIFFLGGETGKDGLIDVFDFKGTMEFWIGENPDSMELHVFDKPCIVRLPPNLWHSPINFTKVSGKIQFMATWLTGTWGTLTRREFKDGEMAGKKYYNYMGDDLRMCILEPTKRCSLCMKCRKLFKDGEFPLGENFAENTDKLKSA